MKSASLLAQISFVVILWMACETACTKVIISGAAALIGLAVPDAPRLLVNAITAVVMTSVMYIAILLADNIDLGSTRVFEISR